MIKKIISAAVLLGTVNMAQAGVFLGGTYGWTSSDIDNAKIDDRTANQDFSESLKSAETWGLRVGGDFDFMRVYVSYDRASADNHGNNVQQTVLLSADYLYPIEKDLRLFAGLSGGGSSLENKGATYEGQTYTAYSKAFGGQLGMLYDFEGWQLEGGYKILKHSTYDKDGDSDRSDYFPTLNITDQFYMALNYRF